MEKLSITEARRTLPVLARRVATSGRSIVLTRRGRPIAKVVPLDPGDEGRDVGSLRGTPLVMSDDFDAPLDELWTAISK